HPTLSGEVVGFMQLIRNQMGSDAVELLAVWLACMQRARTIPPGSSEIQPSPESLLSESERILTNIERALSSGLVHAPFVRRVLEPLSQAAYSLLLRLPDSSFE